MASNETDNHLNAKKDLLSSLQKKIKNNIADVNQEVRIQETNQRADILISLKGNASSRIAIEFQRKPLSIDDWEKRHQLYRSQGIIDIWIFDKETYMKNSKAKNMTHARKRGKLIRHVYNQTGYCHFLDVKNELLIVDYDFKMDVKKSIVRGIKRKQVFDIAQSAKFPLSNLYIRYNADMLFGFISCKDNESGLLQKAEIFRKNKLTV